MGYNKLKQLLGINDTSPKGMGDVQRADEPSRFLPVLQQGYSTPEESEMAQTDESLGLGRPDPEIIAMRKQAIEAAFGMSGGIKKLPNIITKKMIEHPNWLKGAEKLTIHPDQLERIAADIKTHGGLRPKPNYGISALKHIENAARETNPSIENIPNVPREHWVDRDTEEFMKSWNRKWADIDKNYKGSE